MESTVRADVRGVALQTVIVIVVLLAIAGAVAGVLISRGGEAVAEAERQDIVRDASEFTHEGLCESYGLTWTSGSCYRTLPVQPASEYDFSNGDSLATITYTLGRNRIHVDSNTGRSERSLRTTGRVPKSA